MATTVLPEVSLEPINETINRLAVFSHILAPSDVSWAIQDLLDRELIADAGNGELRELLDEALTLEHDPDARRAVLLEAAGRSAE